MAGQSSRSKVVSLRLPLAIIESLEALAKARGVSVAALALEAVQRLLSLGSSVAAPQSSKPRPSTKRRPQLPVALAEAVSTKEMPTRIQHARDVLAEAETRGARPNAAEQEAVRKRLQGALLSDFKGGRR